MGCTASATANSPLPGKFVAPSIDLNSAFAKVKTIDLASPIAKVKDSAVAKRSSVSAALQSSSPVSAAKRSSVVVQERVTGVSNMLKEFRKPVDVDDVLADVKKNPSRHLPKLLAAVQPTGFPSDEDKNRDSIPDIIEGLTRALKNLEDDDSKAVLAACGVIERCASLHETAKEEDADAEIKVDGKQNKQCMLQLASRMKNSMYRAGVWHRKNGCMSEALSNDVKAIATAIASLFVIDDHSKDWKKEMQASGCLNAIMTAVRHMHSVDDDARIAIEHMLQQYTKHPSGKDLQAWENLWNLYPATNPNHTLRYPQPDKPMHLKGLSERLQDPCGRYGTEAPILNLGA